MQNCRNAAAGIVRRKDGIGSGDLNLVYYDAISVDDKIQFESETEVLHFFDIPNSKYMDKDYIKQSLINYLTKHNIDTTMTNFQTYLHHNFTQDFDKLKSLLLDDYRIMTSKSLFRDSYHEMFRKISRFFIYHPKLKTFIQLCVILLSTSMLGFYLCVFCGLSSLSSRVGYYGLKMNFGIGVIIVFLSITHIVFIVLFFHKKRI